MWGGETHIPPLYSSGAMVGLLVYLVGLLNDLILNVSEAMRIKMVLN